jgi:hypothetical protein
MKGNLVCSFCRKHTNVPVFCKIGSCVCQGGQTTSCCSEESVDERLSELVVGTVVESWGSKESSEERFPEHVVGVISRRSRKMWSVSLSRWFFWRVTGSGCRRS